MEYLDDVSSPEQAILSRGQVQHELRLTHIRVR